MKGRAAAFVLLLWMPVLIQNGWAQSTILLEDFEDHQVWYTTSIAEFTDGSQDYFIRTDGSDIGGDVFYNIQGSRFFGAQDIDGEGASLPVSLNINDIIITGYSGLELRVFIGEDQNGSSENWDESDYVHITATIDGGSTQNLIWIENDGSSINSPPYLDEDFDGTGDQTEITDTLLQYSVNISGTGDRLDLSIEFDLNDGGTDIALDHLEILGTKTIPEAIIPGESGWRLLSFPIDGGTPELVSDDTPVQGISGGDDESADSNFKIYNDSGTFEDPVSVDSEIGEGYGFALYFFDNEAYSSSELPVTLDASGTTLNMDVGVSLNTSVNENGAYFTLLGNPFPGNYDLGYLTGNNDGLQDNVHFWNNATGSYSAVDRSSGYVVPPWQGFWVEASAEGSAPTMATFDSDGQTTSSSAGVYFSKLGSTNADIHFVLKSGSGFDEAIRISFREHATTGFDRADASKLYPLLPEYGIMAFKSKGQMKSVESLPYQLEERVELELECLVRTNKDREFFELSWKGLENVPADWSLILYDRLTKRRLNMREVSGYSFEVNIDSAQKITGWQGLMIPSLIPAKVNEDQQSRFLIEIDPFALGSEIESNESPKKAELDQNHPNPFNPSTMIGYHLPVSGEVVLEVFDIMGRKVRTLVKQRQNAGTHYIRFEAGSLAGGIYLYRLKINGEMLTRKMTLIK